MQTPLQALLNAEAKAQQLFQEIEKRGFFSAGKTEKKLNEEIFNIAEEMFGIKKYWHKRIVRAGKNTLLPYRENPPNLTLREDDILFLDFGPVFEDWEADLGRTYVLGNDPQKLKLKNDVEAAWKEGKAYYEKHRDSLTGADFYAYTQELAQRYGWSYGNEHCGHLIGNFPHEKILGESVENYIHPDNKKPMSAKAPNGQRRYWIYEIHFIDEEAGIGGFFEQVMG